MHAHAWRGDVDASALVARCLLCGTKHIYQYVIQSARVSGPQVEQKAHPNWTLRATRLIFCDLVNYPFPTRMTIIQAMDSRL